MAEWWRQLESDLAAADQAIQREHQAAIAAGKPWPPERRPQSEPEHVPKPESNLRTAQEADVQSGPDDQAARLDELFAQATGAAERFTKEKADRDARAQYAARLEREAYAEPEAAPQAEATYEADIELSVRLCWRAGHRGHRHAVLAMRLLRDVLASVVSDKTRNFIRASWHAGQSSRAGDARPPCPRDSSSTKRHQGQ